MFSFIKKTTDQVEVENVWSPRDGRSLYCRRDTKEFVGWTWEEVMAWAKRRGVTAHRFGPDATPPVTMRRRA